MAKVLTFFLLLLGLNLISFQGKLPDQLPRYLDLELNWQDVAHSEFAFEFANSDTLITHEMMLLENDLGLPQMYYSDIETPVCIDGICKPVFIEIYWDLLGSYVGYGVHSEHLLSKYDHEEFEDIDYLKLHQLLRDQHSVLGKRSLESLYDANQVRKEAIKFKGNEVDGITGATRKEVKESVVQGALYSCYTLWYLVREESKKLIEENLAEVYTEDLQNAFLTSSYDPYELHALKQMKVDQFEDKLPMVIPILKAGSPLLRSYVLKKIPNSVYKNPLFVDEIYADLEGLDLNSKTLLIEHLADADMRVFEVVSDQLHHLSKNQMKGFLRHLQGDAGFLTPKVITNLEGYKSDPNSKFGYLVKLKQE